MWAKIRTISRIIWRLYSYAAFLLGTIVFCYLIFAFIVLGVLRVENYDFVIPLRSGFIYHYEMKDGKFNSHHLSDKLGNVTIFSDVKSFMESGNIIYGYREDLHNNPVYFICEYGTDCSSTQNLKDIELRKIIQERKLPLYTNSSGISRDDFMREVNRFHKTVGQQAKLRWEYDPVTNTYKASDGYK